MKNKDKDFTFLEEYFDEYFDEFYSDILLRLKEKNTEYNKLIEIQSKILDDFPKIREIIENEAEVSLNEKEVKALSDYLINVDNARKLEERELFFKGGKEAYHLFKKLEIIN